MVPPDLAARVGGSVSLLRSRGCAAPGRHPGPIPVVRGVSAGPVADVRSAETGGKQSWDGAGRPPTSQDPRPPPELLGRRSECEALDRLLADALADQGRVAVLRGEAGVGKSACHIHVHVHPDSRHSNAPTDASAANPATHQAVPHASP
jgi:hypothetical protein